MRRNIIRWLGVMGLAALLAGGCAGIISEKTGSDGTTQRFRFSSAPKWSGWDHNSTKQDDSSFMLKKESTF